MKDNTKFAWHLAKKVLETITLPIWGPILFIGCFIWFPLESLYEWTKNERMKYDEKREWHNKRKEYLAKQQQERETRIKEELAKKQQEERETRIKEELAEQMAQECIRKAMLVK